MELDVQSALKRLGGNNALYQKLLTRFRDTYTPDAAGLEALLEAGDLISAEREAHTLKGLAGSLGAASLQSAAAALEQTCKSGAGLVECKAALANMQSVLRKVLESIDRHLDPGQQPAPITVDRAALAEKLATLIELLGDNDSSASASFAGLQQELQAAAPDIANTLRRAMDTFDFSKALALAVAARELLSR